MILKEIVKKKQDTDKNYPSKIILPHFAKHEEGKSCSGHCNIISDARKAHKTLYTQQ